MFRLASLGMPAIHNVLGEENFTELPMLILEAEGEWDDFKYRQGIDVLVRYSLTQRVHGEWPGITMHSLVKWRATRRDRGQQWQCLYIKFLLAACIQITAEHYQPEFRRHLVLHLPDVRGIINMNCASRMKMGDVFIWRILARVLYDEGRWQQVEQLLVQVIETRKAKLDEDHPDTLNSMRNLAATYINQGRWEEAEQLGVQVMETCKIKLGEDHPDTLNSIGNLAATFWNQGRWEQAEQLLVQVMETSKAKLGEDHPDTLVSMANLASTWKFLGHDAEAINLLRDCLTKQKQTFGLNHPTTVSNSGTLLSWEMEDSDMND